MIVLSNNQIKAQNTLTETTPIVSYESFINILKNKKYLDDSGKYFFIHLIFPHFPYVFKSDCTYGDDLSATPLE